jgi:hypothetical protein
LIGRYSWLKRSPFKGRRLRRRAYFFADESGCLSDSLMLAVESQRVINLRLAAIARGGPIAEAETRLMVTEKMVAASQAAGMLAQGASTRSVISFYRSRVQENVRRLTQKPQLLEALRLIISRKRFDRV